jgi:DNA-binding CsgD family transcriptional regulator
VLPVFAHVLPLTGSELRTRLQPAAAAAVFVSGIADTLENAELVSAAYDLSPAQTRLLKGQLEGRTLTETAAALDIAPTTAKTHLEGIFAKTGVSRQADLMRLALGIARQV